MDNFVDVEVGECSGDPRQLKGFWLSTTCGQLGHTRTYKPKPICIRMFLNEFIDISILHPV